MISESILIEEAFFPRKQGSKAISIKDVNSDALLKSCPRLPVLSPQRTVGDHGEPHRTQQAQFENY